MLIVCFFLVGLLYITRRVKGPIWLLSFAWLLCMLPVAVGFIKYSYFSPWDAWFVFVLTAYILSFAVGVVVHDKALLAYPVKNSEEADACRYALGWAKFAWVAGAAGSALIIIDYVIYKGSGLNDLAALRDLIVKADSVSWFMRIGSVLTWGCLYCFIFALFFRQTLSRAKFIFFIFPVTGYFLVALLSAGRQTALQIIIFAFLVEFLRFSRATVRKKKEKTSRMFLLGITFVMVVYMGYVAVLRNDGLIDNDKAVVLASLFDFTLSSTAQVIIEFMGESLKSTVIEALVYFSHSIPLFSKFLTIEFQQSYPGTMTFPFILRQLEPFTGVSVIGSARAINQLMTETGVIGVGWTTSISAYIIDFGYIGALLVLFLQGFYTAYYWRRAVRGNDFNEALIALVLLALIIYMPLLAASSETNLLLLWFFGVMASVMRKRRPRQTAITTVV